LGINLAGRIVQHDRSSAEILDAPGGQLLGSHLDDLLATSGATGRPLSSLLDSARAGREATAVLTLRAQRSNPIDAVVTIQPMHGDSASPAALAIVRMPPATVEQFLDPALMRHALLDARPGADGARAHQHRGAALLQLCGLAAAGKPDGR
jgi:hypothetical protein